MNSTNERMDFLVNEFILLYTVSGMSVFDISAELFGSVEEEDKASIREISNRLLGFSGWDEPLNINPWHHYKRVNGQYKGFEVALTKYGHSDIIPLAYRICKKFAFYRLKYRDFS